MSQPTNKEDVKAASDIVQVIGHYVPIRRKGKSYLGKCPFHNDDTPSFSVSPDLQMYQCFGCSCQGDVFEFIMKIEGVNFRDAMELLCNRAGMEFVAKGLEDKTINEKRTLTEVNDIAQEYFLEWFNRSKNSPSAASYFSERGITIATSEKFGLGIAPASSKVGCLSQILAEKGLGRQAVSLGLTNDDGLDTMAGRFTLPIYDGMGRIAGFGGRRASDNIEFPKYINSPDSMVFNKSRLLFGYKQASRALSKGGMPVLVEGFFDVLAAHQIGIDTAVATMGTALTHQQAELLATHSDRIIFCYDSDKTGIEATIRGAKIWQEVCGPVGEVRVAKLPAGEDPASMVQAGFQAELIRIIDNLKDAVTTSMSYESFVIEYTLSKHDLQVQDGRHRALNEALTMIKDVRPFHVRDACLMQVAHLHPFYSVSVGKAIQSLTADMNYFTASSVSQKSSRN